MSVHTQWTPKHALLSSFLHWKQTRAPFCVKTRLQKTRLKQLILIRVLFLGINQLHSFLCWFTAITWCVFTLPACFLPSGVLLIVPITTKSQSHWLFGLQVLIKDNLEAHILFLCVWDSQRGHRDRQVDRQFNLATVTPWTMKKTLNKIK